MHEEKINSSYLDNNKKEVNKCHLIRITIHSNVMRPKMIEMCRSTCDCVLARARLLLKSLKRKCTKLYTVYPSVSVVRQTKDQEDSTFRLYANKKYCFKKPNKQIQPWKLRNGEGKNEEKNKTPSKYNNNNNASKMNVCTAACAAFDLSTHQLSDGSNKLNRHAHASIVSLPTVFVSTATNLVCSTHCRLETNK